MTNVITTFVSSVSSKKLPKGWKGWQENLPESKKTFQFQKTKASV